MSITRMLFKNEVYLSYFMYCMVDIFILESKVAPLSTMQIDKI